MSTTTAAVESIGAVSQQKNTGRRYVKFGEVDDGQGNVTRTIVRSSILQETDKKEPATIKVDGKEVPNPYAGLPVSWSEKEREGYELLSENDVILYNIKSLEGFSLLIPDPAVQLYVIQKGIDVFQQSQLTAFFKSLAENTTDTPEFNGVTLDLRVGIGDDGDYSINKAPSKRAASPEDKLIKNMQAIGASAEQIAAVLAIIRANAPAVAEQEQEEEVA